MNLKGTAQLTVYSLLFITSAYLINIYLGRSLGPKDYGTYGVVISLMTIINLIQTSGLPQALSKYISENESQTDSILKSGLSIQIISTLLFTVIYFLCAPFIAEILNDRSLIPYLQFSACIFPVYGIFALYTGYYNGLHNFKYQAFIGIIYTIAKTTLIIFLAYFFKLQGAILGFIIAPIFPVIVGFTIPRKSVDFYPYKKLIFFSLPLIGFALLSSFLQSIDLYFVKALIHSDNAPGYYTANQNISRIPFFALSAISLVLFPSISKKIKEKNYTEITHMISKSLRLILILLIPGTFLLAATSEKIIIFLYSTRYLPAAPSLSILMFAMGFLTIFTIFANILNGAGMPKKSLYISLMGVFVTSLACIVLIPTYNLVGASLSTVLGCFISMVLGIFLVYKKFPFIVSIGSVIKILFSAVLVSAIAYFWAIPVFLLPFLYIFLLSFYVLLLFLLKEITKEDILEFYLLVPSWIVKKIKI